MTTHPQDIRPALDHLEGALQAACGTLIMLESINTSARAITSDTRAVRDQVNEAIASIREAVAELRELHDAHTSLLAFGFVLASTADYTPAHDQAAQARPRRTA